jgi:hypothetical protein
MRPVPDAPLTRLLALAGPPLGAPGAVPSPDTPAALAPLWRARNGFVAFWSALQVFPVGGGAPAPAFETVDALLRSAYGPLAEGHTAFAQDLFGSLFTWDGSSVCRWDPETGEAEGVADDLDGWAAALLAEPELLAGSAFAFDWQERHGALEAGERLVPLLPWVLDGDWEDANLEPRDTLVALQERAALARAVAELPDGAEIEWPLPGTRLEP